MELLEELGALTASLMLLGACAWQALGDLPHYFRPRRGW